MACYRNAILHEVMDTLFKVLPDYFDLRPKTREVVVMKYFHAFQVSQWNIKKSVATARLEPMQPMTFCFSVLRSTHCASSDLKTEGFLQMSLYRSLHSLRSNGSRPIARRRTITFKEWSDTHFPIHKNHKCRQNATRFMPIRRSSRGNYKTNCCQNAIQYF